jgi:hypothetical protein
MRIAWNVLVAGFFVEWNFLGIAFSTNWLNCVVVLILSIARAVTIDLAILGANLSSP